MFVGKQFLTLLGFGVEDSEKERFQNLFEKICLMRTGEKQVAQERWIAVEPAFFLQEVQKYNASHHLFDVVVENGWRYSVCRDVVCNVSTMVLREVCHYPVIMDMVFVEKLIAERINREGFLEVR